MWSASSRNSNIQDTFANAEGPCVGVGPEPKTDDCADIGTKSNDDKTRRSLSLSIDLINDHHIVWTTSALAWTCVINSQAGALPVGGYQVDVAAPSAPESGPHIHQSHQQISLDNGLLTQFHQVGYFGPQFYCSLNKFFRFLQVFPFLCFNIDFTWLHLKLFDCFFPSFYLEKNNPEQSHERLMAFYFISRKNLPLGLIGFQANTCPLSFFSFSSGVSSFHYRIVRLQFELFQYFDYFYSYNIKKFLPILHNVSGNRKFIFEAVVSSISFY